MVDKYVELWLIMLSAIMRDFLCCFVRVWAVFFGENRLNNGIWGLEDRRMTKRTNLSGCSIIAVFLLGMVSIAGGRTIYVDDDGPADFNTIKAKQDDLGYNVFAFEALSMDERESESRK